MKPVRATDKQDLERAVDVLRRHKDAWTQVSVSDRAALLRACIASYLETAADVVAAGCRAKGLSPSAAAAGEEWLAGPVQVLRNLRLLAETLERIQATNHPLPAGTPVRRTPTGELAVEVFPASRLDEVMYRGTRIDVWMQPEVNEANLSGTMAAAYRGARSNGRTGEGRVTLVLAAGNVASIAPMDVLYKLFVEKRVAVLKMHPVNDYLGPLLERGFKPLIDAHSLRIVYGDAREGQHLIHHPGVDDVHMTGSTAVHYRIVWGETPEEQSLRRAAGTPKLTKPITSELGCVTPVVVVPGEWSDGELQYQAEQVATMVAHSASCTCTSAKVLVTWRRWPQRQRLLARLAEVLAAYPARCAYYPGAAARYGSFLRAYSQSRVLSAPSDHLLPPAVIYDVDPATADDLAFREEAWSPVLAETSLDAADPAEFLHAAVRFCNERLFGTLSAALLVQPRSRARLGAEFDRAVSALRYGTVAINHWTAVNFGLAIAPWGAYPGHTLENIGSGIGVVHNTLMFDHPLKSVVWGPFTSSPKPPWFVTHRRSHVVGRRAAAFEASPSAWRLPGIVVAALRG